MASATKFDPEPQALDLSTKSRTVSESSEATEDSRKNKRKLQEPRRRTTDFSVKRLCQSPPSPARASPGYEQRATIISRAGETVKGTVVPGGHVGQATIPSPAHSGPTPPSHPGSLSPDSLCRVPPYPGGWPFQFYLPPQYAGMYGYPHPALLSTMNLFQRSIAPPNDKSAEGESSRATGRSQSTSSASNSAAVETARTTYPAADAGEDDEAEDYDDDLGLKHGSRRRKNYKNMTRERRVEANARERTRVHTISAAFERLRRAVPSYSNNQKLSKLAILRIACSYILSLARLADMDYSEDQKGLNFQECVELCTKTINAEGRARRRH
ncbi:protein atonal homolog 8-like [Lingula anatina]|uniref:Protein atonal homolog 8-like n=1 Tax=Lingula anatina TaxID=7574 RepID=A0A2R2MMM8_LINAN|nr:protein atonal homolog 8-like [Lingula anatina]|eukprot:XP_023931465.1 protein atonal homolog 8-like [Lingula anatina]